MSVREYIGSRYVPILGARMKALSNGTTQSRMSRLRLFFMRAILTHQGSMYPPISISRTNFIGRKPAIIMRKLKLTEMRLQHITGVLQRLKVI